MNDIESALEGIIFRIKEKRHSKGLSLENVANEIGLSASAYMKIERMETKLTVERLLQLQTILDVSISEFFDLKVENIYNQEINDSGIGHQEIENLYQENKEASKAIIENLKDEVLFLRSQIISKNV